MLFEQFLPDREMVQQYAVMQMPAKLEALAEEMRVLSIDRTFGIEDGEFFPTRGHCSTSLFLSCFHHCQLPADLCVFNRGMHGSSKQTGDLDVDKTFWR